MAIMESERMEERTDAEQAEPKKGFFQRIKHFVRTKPRQAAIYGGLILLLIIGFFIPVDPPHVSMSGEPIFSNGPKWFTNSLLTTFIVDIFLILLAVAATRSMKIVPGGLQNLMELIIEQLFGLAESIAGKDTVRYFPWVATVFLFVIFSNWSGLIPGVGSVGFVHKAEETHMEAPADGHGEEQKDEEHNGEPTDGEHSLNLDGQLAMAGGDLILVEPRAVNPKPAAAEEGHDKLVPLFRAPSADLNMTFALALVIMTMVQVWGVRALKGHYFNKFFTLRGQGAMKGINAFVGILELVSEISRVVAFGFRLFGNIFAGEIILATMAFLVTFLLPLPFYVLEVFVGFVQALVFMMLAVIFFSLSTVSHSEEHH